MGLIPTTATLVLATPVAMRLLLATVEQDQIGGKMPDLTADQKAAAEAVARAKD